MPCPPVLLRPGQERAVVGRLVLDDRLEQVGQLGRVDVLDRVPLDDDLFRLDIESLDEGPELDLLLLGAVIEDRAADGVHHHGRPAAERALLLGLLLVAEPAAELRELVGLLVGVLEADDLAEAALAGDIGDHRGVGTGLVLLGRQRRGHVDELDDRADLRDLLLGAAEQQSVAGGIDREPVGEVVDGGGGAGDLDRLVLTGVGAAQRVALADERDRTLSGGLRATYRRSMRVNRARWYSSMSLPTSSSSAHAAACP